jgi:hypothetical protein
MNKPVRIATMRLLYAHGKIMRDSLVKYLHNYVLEKQENGGVTNDYDLPPLSKKKTMTKNTKTTAKNSTKNKRKAAITPNASKRRRIKEE